MLSLVTVCPVIIAFHSCCLSHHIFDQVNLWPSWVGIETAIFRQCSPGTVETQRLYPLRHEPRKKKEFPIKIIIYTTVIYEALCFDVAQGRLIGAPNETYTTVPSDYCITYLFFIPATILCCIKPSQSVYCSLGPSIPVCSYLSISLSIFLFFFNLKPMSTNPHACGVTQGCSGYRRRNCIRRPKFKSLRK